VKAVISAVPGIVSYYLIHDGSDTVPVTVAHDKAGVEQSNEEAAAWLREHASDVPASPHRITEGEVLVTLAG